ncbi:MAG: chromate transporter [Ruthenibacterium lactatiformans]
MIHLELFWSFFQIGLFSIGGGYAAMPLIQHQVVELHPWLTLEAELGDIITISQMTPGPIAINSATFVGLQLGGLPGALVATAGCVLPSCIIVLTLAYVYYRYRGLSMVQGLLAGLRPAVVAMIASAGVTLVNLSFFGADALPAGLADVDPSLPCCSCSPPRCRAGAWRKDPIPCDGGRGRGGACAVHAAVRHCAIKTF